MSALGTACLALGLAVLVSGAAEAQLYQERNQAISRCYRDAQRSAGSAPRTNPRPGDDLVTMERTRRDYDDRYYSYLSRCLDEADRTIRQKRQ
jgi:hypothetical protein